MSKIADLKVADAYMHCDATGLRWTIGTEAVEQVFESKDGQLQLVSYRNKLSSPPTEYIDKKTPLPFFDLAAVSVMEPVTFEKIWSAIFPRQEAVCMIEGMALQVQAGDVLVFRIDRMDEASATIKCNIGLQYEDHSSFDAPSFSTESFYTLDKSGSPEKLVGTAGEIPGSSTFEFGTMQSLMRFWKAPHSGTIHVNGSLVSGYHGEIEASIQLMKNANCTIGSTPCTKWKVEKCNVREVPIGGRPVAQLDLVLRNKTLRVHLHMITYPGTSIIRHWMEIENTGTDDFIIPSAVPFSLLLRNDKSKTWVNSWMTGADSSPTQGVMRRAEVGNDYHNSLTSDRTRKYMPWMAMEHGQDDGDGLFVSSESLCDWNMTVISHNGSPTRLAVNLLSYEGMVLNPGDTVVLPPITSGVFTNGLDGMGMRIYDWQYQYLWDYTNQDYYARTQYLVPWVFSSRNLQEQFSYRLAGLDMAGAEFAREAGVDMIWDDAGWSKYPGYPVPDGYPAVFNLNYEGPDFSRTQRFLGKMGAKWLLWFCGRPSAGVMDSKMAAWGAFQWRTDAVGPFTPESEAAFRASITGFLDRNPQASFHTCDGGSQYAHTYGIQRLADLNYLSDFGRGDETNYYFSYVDTPDKWTDILEGMSARYRYNPQTAKQMLCLVPNWLYSDNMEDRELLRSHIMELYHYLLDEGVAGRWSYVFHPAVVGDNAIYYFQRASHDRTKSLIILKHCAKRSVVVYPRGLLPEHHYTVGFDSKAGVTTRCGSDLMKNGIVIKKQKPGELIYLGLQNRPGTARGKTTPRAVGRVLKRFESNLGHSGVGIYWSAAAKEQRVSYYEVRRDKTILGKAATGCYYFDHSEGWNQDTGYSVRAIGRNGVSGPWKDAEPAASEPLSYHALGGHYCNQGRDGWSAEISRDGKRFTPMTFISPAKNPQADQGGSPNQTGGVEGYWEGADTARIGRGWQQTSKDAASSRTWTAPQSGCVRILGRAMKECFRKDLGSESLHVEIRHGTRLLWQGELKRGSLDGVTHDLKHTVRSGDVLRFILGKSSDPDNDMIAWMPKIIYDGTVGAANGNSVVRISCGSDDDSMDSSGNVWQKDSFYNGGVTITSAADIESTTIATGDVGLYQTGREGDEFTYCIPVKPGLYSLRLKFAETDTRWFFERPMDICVNGNMFLQSFDICQETRGVGNTCEKSFHNIVPDESGCINLLFKGVSSPIRPSCRALVRALEILPEWKPVVRINCGSKSSFVDWNTNEWAADESHRDCMTLTSAAAVKLATPTIWDQKLYRTALSGREIAYRFALSPGLYTVQLKFAELWLDTPGARPMDISVNGQTIKHGWDPALAVGKSTMSVVNKPEHYVTCDPEHDVGKVATGIRIENVAPDKDGSICIRFVAAGENNAIIQAIEIE